MGDAVHWANLDGTGQEMIVSAGGSTFWGIAVSPVRGALYIADDGRIRSANLDGSNLQDHLTGLTGAVRSIAFAVFIPME